MTVIDTKVDLAVSPVDWLSRALHAWEPAGTFGQLQNQAYGYLWPMGPFFAAGWWLAIPAWAVQRLWWALVMCVAFTGVVRLADRMAIGTPTSRIIAGLAFALSPRILTELGPVSVEAWPTAIAPWVLVPLIGIANGASLRQAVARSALAVACAGGVNATAVLAVLPLGVLWLATVRPLRRRVAAIMAWVAAVGLATAWWVIPLLLLGRYSPPFLDYIETAEVTTRTTDLVTVLRGASHWLAYLGGPHGPTWSVGWRLASEPVLIAATLIVAGLGLAGLARRGMPHRRFLVTGLLVGVALVGFGHLAAVDGGLAGIQRAFLDGSGAPLRNVHKFDVVLRLPLVLGLAHLVGLLARSASGAAGRWHPRRVRAAVVTATSLAAVAVVASPALAGGLAVQGSFHEVPGYWRQASAWLDANLGRDRALVVPAARFPRYLWGSPSDEITQPLLQGAWAVRNSIPLTPSTTVRLLDAVESALADGSGSPALADLLARSGVRYLLVRADLDYGRSDSARPLMVRQALARSPGLSRVATFGPMVGGGYLPGNYVDHGMDTPVRALEIFRVNRSVDPVVAYDAGAVTTVVGGPESLLALGAAGALSPAPTILAGEVTRAGRLAITDGLRRREVAFGLSRDNASATLDPDELWTLDAPEHDYLPAWAGADDLTVVRYHGVAGISAASSMAQTLPLSGSRPEYQPFAAIDGDPTTAWRSAPGIAAVGQWLEVELAGPRIVSDLRLVFDQGADSVPTRITVTAGSERATVDVTGSTAAVHLPGRFPTKRLRITVDAVFDIRAGFGGVGVAELKIPDVKAERTLVVPTPPATTSPATVVLSAAPTVPSCVFLDGRPYCSPNVARASEDGNLIDRTITLPSSASYTPTVWARPRPGPQLSALLDRETSATGVPTVTASSTGMPDPAARPGAAVDGDPNTVWYAAEDDKHPWLRLTWPAARTVTGLTLTLDPAVAAARPWAVTAMGDGGVRGGTVEADGTVAFEQPMRTDELTVLLSDTAPAKSYDPYRNRFDLLPVAVGEVTALPDRSRRAADLDVELTLPCGSGPTLDIAGRKFSTSITATRRQLLELQEVPATVCKPKPVALQPGESRIVAAGTTVSTPTRLALTPPGRAAAAQRTPVTIEGWSATERHLRVEAHPVDRMLALRENTNPGWRATVAGQTLRPVVLDGWQQGWVLPAGLSGDVTLRFEPDTPYRIGLAGGAALLVAVLIAALVAVRRSPKRIHTGRPGYRRPILATVVGGVALLSVGGLALLGLAAAGGAALIAYRALLPNLSRYDRRTLHRAAQVFWRWLPVVLFALAGVLSLTSDDRHQAAGPQLAALAAASVLWLSVAVRIFRRAPSH